MSDPLVLFARITPKPEHRAAARDAVLNILAVTRSEPGCRRFTLHEDRDGDGPLYLYEIWDDDAALAAHHAQPYTCAVFDQYRTWLSGPVEITRLRRIGEEAPCSS
ncbi:putative quinol monooxygenase [Methylobacterium sp. J-090]|uniref:putative quinol monooxygenase n=1 Tax=Methylobacterium sp. J-090 TaxID=2836666 RepID=UPI001FB9C799|nr:putative quinol monooxygenase [Methylobacterium sp. J-090]MCJ2082845.1 antibiotic biosynthesis monooxygenase [Methylobacterium sp. J-090]